MRVNRFLFPDKWGAAAPVPGDTPEPRVHRARQVTHLDCQRNGCTYDNTGACPVCGCEHVSGRYVGSVAEAPHALDDGQQVYDLDAYLAGFDEVHQRTMAGEARRAKMEDAAARRERMDERRARADLRVVSGTVVAFPARRPARRGSGASGSPEAA